MRIVLVTLGVATAIHLDWHFARPAHHQLSLGWSHHWLLAVPVFALAAWYVARAWPDRVGMASAVIVVGGVFVAQAVEPSWEFALGGAPFEWAFGAPRQAAFAAYMAAGIVAYVATLALMRRRRAPQI